MSGGITIGNSDVSFWGGAGNDTFNFGAAATSGSAANFYFGSGDGSDSIYFAGGQATAHNVTGLMTINIDSAFGATSSASNRTEQSSSSRKARWN